MASLIEKLRTIAILLFALQTSGIVPSLLMFFVHDAYRYWVKFNLWALRILRFRKLEKSVEMTDKPHSMILFNHRTMADGFAYDIPSKHSCAGLSRMLVAFAMPFAGLVGFYTRSMWYFKRGGRGSNLNDFYNWIDMKFKDSEKRARQNLFVCPEGHRSTKPKALPLKFGMIKYAYERNRTVQICIVRGTEYVFNEKTLKSNINGSEVIYCWDKEMTPSDYPTVDAFCEEVSRRFNETFDYVYAQPINVDIPKQSGCLQELCLFGFPIACTVFFLYKLFFWFF